MSSQTTALVDSIIPQPPRATRKGRKRVHPKELSRAKSGTSLDECHQDWLRENIDLTRPDECEFIRLLLNMAEEDFYEFAQIPDGEPIKVARIERVLEAIEEFVGRLTLVSEQLRRLRRDSIHASGKKGYVVNVRRTAISVCRVQVQDCPDLAEAQAIARARAGGAVKWTFDPPRYEAEIADDAATFFDEEE